jgi:hypothetical protein
LVQESTGEAQPAATLRSQTQSLDLTGCNGRIIIDSTSSKGGIAVAPKKSVAESHGEPARGNLSFDGGSALQRSNLGRASANGSTHTHSRQTVMARLRNRPSISRKWNSSNQPRQPNSRRHVITADVEEELLRKAIAESERTAEVETAKRNLKEGYRPMSRLRIAADWARRAQNGEGSDSIEEWLRGTRANTPSPQDPRLAQQEDYPIEPWVLEESERTAAADRARIRAGIEAEERVLKANRLAAEARRKEEEELALALRLSEEEERARRRQERISERSEVCIFPHSRRSPDDADGH